MLKQRPADLGTSGPKNERESWIPEVESQAGRAGMQVLPEGAVLGRGEGPEG